MEVDVSFSSKDLDNNSTEGGTFGHLKAFVAAAREFEATHSESAVNLMNRYLGLIASSCDLSIFSPGRSEVCAFFSSLWRVMCNGRAPHWACVAVLARACMETSARHALTHTYKFMPILARLLADNISNDKKIKLLSVMQDISYGVKISWQESYLGGLMKQLTSWITRPTSEPQHKAIGQKSLTVLVNVCYGNLPAIYALMRTVDTKEFVVHLINLKDGGYGGVEVCRLLVCLSGASRGTGAIRQADVHSYLCCTMKTFNRAIREIDATQLLHAYTFINDLCTDNNLRSFVLTYQHFISSLKDAIQDIEDLCQMLPDNPEPESGCDCLQNIFKFLTVLINLDLYTLRCLHGPLFSVCVKGSRLCLPESLELFAAIVNQYRDEDRLPQELISVIGEGLPGLLVPPTLEPGKAGLQWLQVVGALSESAETQERVLQEVSPESFEDTLYSVLQYMSQKGALGTERSQYAVLTGCRVGLELSPHSEEWRGALTRLLAHHQVRKLLCLGLTSNDGSRRRQVLQLVKHHYFPSDQMNQVFGDTTTTESQLELGCRSRSGADVSCDAQHSWHLAHTLTPAREDAIDALITKLNLAFEQNQITDIATSSVMELYGYKMTCLEQRLHSHTLALQGATDHMASLQHTVAMLQATNSTQQDVLYTTQMHSEKHKERIEELHKQLEDAEVTVRGFRAKLAAERLEREHQADSALREYNNRIANIENEVKAREREAEERLRKAEMEYKGLQKKLEQQTNKNNELAGVLVKFEERVKQRDKRLEEAAASEGALRREIDHKDITVKQLEKTVLERENRLYQVTTQLEEMKRVQEMVAKLMSKSTSAAGAS